MRPRDEPLVLDMLLASRRVAGYASGITQGGLEANDILQDAIIRQLLVIGEAANQISIGRAWLIPPCRGTKSSECVTTSFTGTARLI